MRIGKQRHYFTDKGPSSQSYGFSSSHVWMWELDHKEGWTLKNWCFWTVVLEKAVESPLDCKEIQPVNSKGNQPWIFIGSTDAETDTPVLWPPEGKSRLIRKDPDAGKDWGQEEKGMTEDEMVGWHHQLHGHEFEQALGDGEGQGSPARCSPWSCKESDTAERLNSSECLHAVLLGVTTVRSQRQPAVPFLVLVQTSSSQPSPSSLRETQISGLYLELHVPLIFSTHSKQMIDCIADTTSGLWLLRFLLQLEFLPTFKFPI